jgi:hypothetical protein
MGGWSMSDKPSLANSHQSPGFLSRAWTDFSRGLHGEESTEETVTVENMPGFILRSFIGGLVLGVAASIIFTPLVFLYEISVNGTKWFYQVGFFYAKVRKATRFGVGVQA